MAHDGGDRLLVTIVVNGKTTSIRVEPRTTLVEYLRDELRLTGTHVGCEQGACGACTVLLDGAAVRSCLILAVQADGHEVRTVESLVADEELPGEEMPDLQQAFLEKGAAQCGFCTPGFLMLAGELLADTDGALDETAARRFLSANICRCTGYAPIIAAVVEVAACRARAAPHPESFSS